MMHSGTSPPCAVPANRRTAKTPNAAILKRGPHVLERRPTREHVAPDEAESKILDAHSCRFQIGGERTCSDLSLC